MNLMHKLLPRFAHSTSQDQLNLISPCSRMRAAVVSCVRHTAITFMLCALCLVAPLLQADITKSDYRMGEDRQCFPDFHIGMPFREKLEEIRAEHWTPALAGLITYTGSGSQIAAVGSRKWESPLLANASDVDKWHIGSNGKAMTAALVAVLKDKYGTNGLDFDTTVQDVFPYPLYNVNWHFRYVTIGQLLSHKAGAPTDRQVTTFQHTLGYNTNLTPTQRRLDFSFSILRGDRFNADSKGSRYSNAGYAIVSAMLEHHYSQTFESLMINELFVPLQMFDSGFGVPVPTNSEPWGHRAEKGKPDLFPTTDTVSPYYAAAGNIHTTLQDYTRFLRLVMHGSEGSITLSSAMRKALLPADELESGYLNGWGYGYTETAAGNRSRIFSHDGSDGHWYFAARVYPDIGAATVAATNTVSYWHPKVVNYKGSAKIEQEKASDEGGFVVHGPAAVYDAIDMLYHHLTGCPTYPTNKLKLPGMGSTEGSGAFPSP